MRDCERVFTPSFIQLAFNGLAACRKHIAEVAKLPPRTVRIIGIKRQGPVADARIRVDSTARGLADLRRAQPELLSRPGTVAAVEPDHARWLAR